MWPAVVMPGGEITKALLAGYRYTASSLEEISQIRGCVSGVFEVPLTLLSKRFQAHIDAEWAIPAQWIYLHY